MFFLALHDTRRPSRRASLADESHGHRDDHSELAQRDERASQPCECDDDA